MSARLTRGTVVVATERCKGCELCIPACPPGVLLMSTQLNEVGFRYPELVAGCTACRACHEVCPDFVFEVFKFDEPVDDERLAAAIATMADGATAGTQTEGEAR